MWKLINTKTGEPAPAYGTEVTDFRGDPCILVDATPPHKEGSSGRVHVRFPEGGEAEFFPSVVGLKWVEV